MKPEVAEAIQRPSHPLFGMSTVVALTAHARDVPSGARARFAADLEPLANHPGAIVVHTCHRVEVYVAVEALGDIELPEPPPGSNQLRDKAAVEHLITVACGMDSAVLGEEQILHQIRGTYTSRRDEHPLNTVLDRLFGTSLQAGKRARSWFSGTRRSLADSALDEIELRAGSLTDQTILVIGAGSMARLTANAAVRRGASVLISGRTHSRAAALAGDVEGTAIPWGGTQPLPTVSGMVVAISGQWPAHESDAQNLAANQTVIVDLSSTPATPEPIQTALGDRFVSIDDLAFGPQEELPTELRTRLDQLVFESGRDYCRWLRVRTSGSLIQEMIETVQTSCRKELERLSSRLGNLSDEDRDMIEHASHRLAANILHAPCQALNADETGTLEVAARELFQL